MMGHIGEDGVTYEIPPTIPMPPSQSQQVCIVFTISIFEIYFEKPISGLKYFLMFLVFGCYLLAQECHDKTIEWL